jgi:dihydroneopterin aldolase
MNAQAFIELRDLSLKTQIGTYEIHDTRPKVHLLDLTLGIDTNQVLISRDAMVHVFDYDPLIAEIDRLAQDGHYETQERLMTRIACACVVYSEIKTVELCLRKAPVHNDSGSLGVRLLLNEASTNHLRNSVLPSLTRTESCTHELL